MSICLLEADIHRAQTASTQLGLEVIVVNGGTENEIGTAFASAAHQGIGAQYLGSNAMFTQRRGQIGGLGLRYKLPTMSRASHRRWLAYVKPQRFARALHPEPLQKASPHPFG